LFYFSAYLISHSKNQAFGSKHSILKVCVIRKMLYYNNNFIEKPNSHTSIKKATFIKCSKNIVLRPLYEVILILWKPIPRFPQYIISNFGVVINTISSKKIKSYITYKGYAYINLNCKKTKTSYKFRINRLVGIVYLTNPFNKPTVDHKNRNRLDNYVGNLVWSTHGEQRSNQSPRGTHTTVQLLTSPTEVVFKDIPTHLANNMPGFKISNSGRVLRPCGKLTTGKVPSNYVPTIMINYRYWLLHRLLASVFIANVSNFTQVNHKDGNVLNCTVENLEWCDGDHNGREAYRIGLRKPTYKPVLQFTIEGVLVQEHASVKSAIESLGLTRHYFTKYIKGKEKNPLFVLKFK